MFICDLLDVLNFVHSNIFKPNKIKMKTYENLINVQKLLYIIFEVEKPFFSNSYNESPYRCPNRLNNYRKHKSYRIIFDRAGCYNTLISVLAKHIVCT